MAAHGVRVSFPVSGPRGQMNTVVEITFDNWVSETQHHFPYQVVGRKTVTMGEEMRSGREYEESGVTDKYPGS